MRMHYWLLGVFTLLFLLILGFLAFPALMILVGLFTGTMMIYMGRGTAVADAIIRIGAFTWKHWLISLISIMLLTGLFVLLTNIAHHARRFRHIVVKPKAMKGKPLKVPEQI